MQKLSSLRSRAVYQQQNPTEQNRAPLFSQKRIAHILEEVDRTVSRKGNLCLSALGEIFT